MLEGRSGVEIADMSSAGTRPLGRAVAGMKSDSADEWSSAVLSWGREVRDVVVGREVREYWMDWIGVLVESDIDVWFELIICFC